jgi:N-acetylglucosamine-6-sulfatase
LRLSARRPPNIVFVLTDDLSWDLVRFMPHVRALESRGLTFTRYVVTDSLCCPSRSSIFTGLYPHDTGVFTNTGPDGGFNAFRAHHLGKLTFAVALQQRGYLTSLLGKYLNGYEPGTLRVPPGWDDWHVAGDGYSEFNYNLNENGKLVHYGGPSNPANYLTDVLARRATSFIGRAAHAHKPFMLEVATFAPHDPYVPAPRNANDFPGLRAPRDPSFNRANVDPPSWLGVRKRLGPKMLRILDTAFRKRAQAVEGVDRLIAEVEAALREHGLAGDTYIVFSSDNGYHIGQHRLEEGKLTAFDTDIRVPLVVAGPGVPRGRTVSRLAENVDLYPTFLGLAGATPHHLVDGHSLVPLLRGRQEWNWRTAALIEHHGPDVDPTDPDYEKGKLGGNPTSYEAIRLVGATIARRPVSDAVYVEYRNGQREYYDIARDPYERVNVYSRLDAAQRAQLHGILRRLSNCHGPAACWTGEPLRTLVVKRRS